MTIKRRAAGFGLEWPGDGVAAFLFEGGGSQYFRRSGGWATGAILAPCGRFRLFRLMPPPNDITINWPPRWCGRKRPGDGVAALLLGGGNQYILGILGGRYQRPFWHRADDFDCSA